MIHTALISFLADSINTRLLAAYLKKNNYAVICIFCPVEFNENNLNALIEILKEKKIALAGVSLVTDDYYPAVTVTRAIKEKIGIPVIWGGAHVDVRPEECLREADMICRGEGEEALLELVENLSADKPRNTAIKNIWFRQEKLIVRNELRGLEENLDKYPFADFDLDTQYLLNEKGIAKANPENLRKEYSVMTSRGCPYSCFYCYNNYRRKHFQGKGKYVRFRSVENVIQELAQAKKLFKNLERINFWDDSFLARGREDFQKFRELYSENIKIPFFVLAEPMAFQEEKIKILKDCGLIRVQMGIQTGSPRINREIYNRQISNEAVIGVANILHDLGISATYDLIFNNPFETRDDIIETIRLILRFPKPFSLQGFNLIFYPGTEITERALREGLISAKTIDDDFSTIQGENNTPLFSRKKSVISSRFYTALYDSKEKAYLNSLFCVISSGYLPGRFFEYFIKSETPLKKFLLRLIIVFYLGLVRLKNLRFK